MAITNSQYHQIMKVYENRRFLSHYALEEKIKEIEKQVPQYSPLCHQISSLSVACAKQALQGDDLALSSMKEELSLLRRKKEEVLAKAGYGSEDLQPSYICSDCKDTGYIDSQKCHCFSQQIIDLLYEQSNIKDYLKENNFSALSLSYYEGEDLLRFQNAVKTCKDFIHDFNSDYHNLFFYGTVGTGKSFLSGCIAKELLDSGHCVIYFSAAALFERLAQSSFSYNKEDEDTLQDDLYSCDLLIIDDLGTEMWTHFSSSQFFSCLNERILRKKSVIISTNLSLQELRDRYSDRIFSRITSNFDLCKITGPDIRMQKKRFSHGK